MRAEIKLPFRDCKLNQDFLIRFGLRVVKGYDAPPGEVTFRAGNALECIHSKVRARIMCSKLEKSPKTSRVYRVITVSNRSINNATFQSLFYDFFDGEEGKNIANIIIKNI
jgi:hypothetical protein